MYRTSGALMHTTLARSLLATALSLLLAFALPAPAATVTITPVPTNGKVTSNVGGINCGTGGSTCTSNSITAGTSVSLTATPDAGYSFVQWSMTGSGTSTSNPLTFPMPSTNVSGSVTFVGTAPTITSANATTFTVLSPGTFTVTATGTPTPTFAVTTGALPAGVTLSSAGTLSGTPSSGTVGFYPVAITASNGVNPAATQTFALTVAQASQSISIAPALPSTVTLGAPPLTVSASATSGLAVTIASTTPTVCTVSGSTVTYVAGGTCQLQLSQAGNADWLAASTITANITVQSAPAITSANNASFTVLSPGTFTIISTGTPTAAISLTGTLPAGLSFTTPVPGQAVISGTPAGGAGGSYPLTITAANGILPNATQSFTLTVGQPPSFTGAASTTFTVGTPGTFTVTTSGFPAPGFTVTNGVLPEGITLSPAGILSGTPANGTAGVYSISITASNGVPSDASAAFTLNVAQAPGLVATPIVNFDGLGKDFTGPGGAFTVNFIPPDAGIAVGPSHVVQVVNSSYAVFNKAGGLLQGPVALSSLWAGLPNAPCAQAAEPIARYDRAAGRFVIVALVSDTSSPALCIAVSVSGDPTGAYAPYAFALPSHLYDPPRLGVWPDGYYVTFNLFNAASFAYQGVKACALDRSRLLAGSTATMQCFDQSSSYYTLVPSDLDGPNPPPAGAPNVIAALDLTGNKLDLFQMHVDWSTPANTTFTGPTIIDTAAYADPCTGSVNCIPQAGTSTQLHALGGMLMYRAAYRNFGDHESLVLVHSVNAGLSTGVRWYELRSPATSPTIFQQGTFAPDADHRWAGSGAMDASGNLALGYSVSSAAIKPQIRYAARLANDPPGQLPLGEATIFAGAGAQTGNRWGDTTALHIDPSDDCTFWYTNQYIPADGNFNWRTRIASFRPLGACPTAPLAATGSPTGVIDTGATLNGTVSANLGTTTVTFEYGTTTSYGTSVAATQSPLAATTSSTGVSATITGLSCTTLYHFRVSATNSAGTTHGTDATFTTSACVPGVPTIGVATPGNGQATVAFTPPVSDGGSPITGYTATCTPGAITASGTSSPITVTGLANGTTYSCSVAATNAIGTGPSSGTVAVTPAAPVTAPSVTTNAAGAITGTGATLNGSVTANGATTTVTFEYGTTTSYGNTTAAAQSPLASNATSVLVSASVTGLSCGTLYHYRVNGTNSAGTTHGNDSAFNTTACPTAPHPSNIANIRPGDGKATVLFVAPDDGGSPILQYTVTCQPGAHVGVGTSSPVVVMGLTNGTTYSCSLTATNAVGTGIASLASNVTPVAATSTSYAFIPDAAANQGDLAIVDLSTGMVVKTLSLGPGTLGGVAANPGAGKAYVVVWGQNDHIAQIDTSTLTVTATLPLPANTGGGNLAVSPNGARLYQASTALSQIQVVDVATQSLVGSIPVGINPGSMGFDATGTKLYVVNNSRLTILDTQTSTVLATITQGSLPTPLAGPARAVAVGIIDTYVTTANVNGSAVSVVDSSSNAVLAPISSTVLPVANPGAIALTPNGRELWTTDPTAGKVYFFDTITNASSSADVSAPSAIAFDATGSVAAVSSATTGITTLVDPVAHLPFATVATTTPPSTLAYFITTGPLFSAIAGAPVATTGTATVISATGVTMNGTVSADGFSTTVSFDYGTTASYGTSVAATQSPLSSNATSSAVSVSVTGLACGTLYHFRVSATNSAGTTHGNDATFTTSACATTPGAPTIGAATPGSAQATIAFAPPTSDGGSPITSYTVSCTPGPVTATGAASPITVTGLANGTTYTCSVAATNGVGTGASSGTVSVTPVSSGVAPTITSANHATFTVNTAGSFTVTATGTPTPTLLIVGTPPSGVTFTPATGVLAGTPALGTVGVHSLTFNANSTTLPNASQAFTLTVAKAGQSIAFANPGPQTASGTPVALSATASSGLPVSFTSLTTTVCTVAGTQLTLEAAGTCTIAADQAGDANYNAAVQVQQSFAVGETPRLSGISTRMPVLTGDNVMIAGFIVGGSTPKTVVVRARGPSLGIAGALADPVLTLVPADGSAVTVNDDWGSAANAAQLAAAHYQPGNAKESAVMATLNPGAYTAIVSGAGGTTGIAIVEVYELDHPEIPMVGISTRGLVQTGDNVMIGGFIIQGSGPQTVVVRARGPSLGVAGAVANPVLTIVPGDGSPPMVNDDWASAANAAELEASRFQPANPKESALLLTLNPGAYTAIVSGAGGTTGVAIVEVFAVP